jgi:hypothetical protein
MVEFFSKIFDVIAHIVEKFFDTYIEKNPVAAIFSIAVALAWLRNRDRLFSMREALVSKFESCRNFDKKSYLKSLWLVISQSPFLVLLLVVLVPIFAIDELISAVFRMERRTGIIRVTSVGLAIFVVSALVIGSFSNASQACSTMFEVSVKKKGS